MTIEISNKKCRGLKMLEDLRIQQYTLVDVRSLGKGLVRPLVKIPPGQTGRLADGSFTKVHGSKKLGEGTSAWFDTGGCDFCNVLLDHNAFLISGRNVEAHTLIHSFVAPSFEAFQKIMSELEANGLEPKILSVGKFKPKSKILTERQERTLWLALKMGFFEYPKKIHSAELSRRLGIAPSTLSEVTRRGLRRLLEAHFET